MSHHLFQESKNCKLGFFFLIMPNIKELQDKIFFQHPALPTRRPCPSLQDSNSQALLLICSLRQYSFSSYLLIPLFYTQLEYTNGSSLPRGFLFCHFFLGNVIKELGAGCFTHIYSDSLLAINGCRFYYLSGLVIAFLPRRKCLLNSWLQSPSAMIWEPKIHSTVFI